MVLCLRRQESYAVRDNEALYLRPALLIDVYLFLCRGNVKFLYVVRLRKYRRWS